MSIIPESSTNHSVVKQYRALLAISETIISQRDLTQLFHDLSERLKKILHFDYITVMLYDREHDLMRLHLLETSVEVSIKTGLEVPLEKSGVGWVWQNQKPLFIDDFDLEERFPVTRELLQRNNIQSCYAFPLTIGERKLGGMTFGCHEKFGYDTETLEFLQEVVWQVALALDNALQFEEIEQLKNKLANEKLYLEEEIKASNNFAEIIGTSRTLKKVLQQVETVAPTDAVVLIQGETGTGKELIARAVHNFSNRRERTLVKLNCAAIPTGLLESELFGHERGAFTGAMSQRIGRFELAHKGTLFLDEVGDIPLELQPKLLRVLQEGEFERLGSSRTIKAEVRLVAATNRDLQEMVAEGTFRADLYYRLNVFPVLIPSLRERREDIPLLVSYFVQKHSRQMNKKIKTIPNEAMAALTDHSWEGNIRELENFIERAVILSPSSELRISVGELKNGRSVPPETKIADETIKLVSLEENERTYIREVLRHTNGVIGGRGGAAEILDLPVSTLRSRMKKLGLK
jgi:formate hydrogenlyase transcriptional activator